ncbi:MAG: hypothetical protein AUK35_05985 [Zetaproteobacteria bacterium CG2_30_46_52]|nr:MAG: hypothetical protein AUK35_05985 [Zetaproteobacteria bacterium CG2_30_46_52]
MFANKAMYFHYTEWVMNHPRFVIVMAVLILLSITSEPWLAAVLFILFSIEIGHRIALMRYRSNLNPYKMDPRRKSELFFLALDMVAVASLLLTVFESTLPMEAGVLARFARIMYLLRAIRLFRYIDLQSILYSPTYGMLVSLIVIMSFFAEGMYLMAILIFFSVEIAVRFIITSNMHFVSRKQKTIEWFFWWVDLAATVAMLPMFAVLNAGAALRVLRLARLLRPWLVIGKNLVAVVREGQFMQEINLIILILAVLSLGGGFIGNLTHADYDFSRDGQITEVDHEMLAPIWFAFRAFTDPGNSVPFPESNSIAVFSVVAVLGGVFMFAFFIGIGASIVSGLMGKLRNNDLNIANHIVMLGWNDVSPFVLQQLNILSQRTFSRVKLVLLHDEEKQPEGLTQESWVTFRWGDMENSASLKRINLAMAKQAIVNVPDQQSASENLAHSFFSLLAIRAENPDIFINYATPGLSTPHLKSYHHQLQVGWDKKNFYNKPTVILSQADVRANLLRQVLSYPDFDQIISRLMIPVRHDESTLQVIEWSGSITVIDEEAWMASACVQYQKPLKHIIQSMFSRGVILVAIADTQLCTYPALSMNDDIQIAYIVGIALDANSLMGEIDFALRQEWTPQNALVMDNSYPLITKATRLDSTEKIRVVIIGRVEALPLMLKRLLNSFSSVDVVILDDLSPDEHADQQAYIRRRIGEMEGADARISTTLVRWDFSNMDFLREHVHGADRIIISKPAHISKRPHAIVANVLSHLMTILDELHEKPFIFPLVDSREQAEMLQKELYRFDVEHEVHVVVPHEFYGTYVAHTSFGMFSAPNAEVYNSQRVLRYVIDDLMADCDKLDAFISRLWKWARYCLKAYNRSSTASCSITAC